MSGFNDNPEVLEFLADSRDVVARFEALLIGSDDEHARWTRGFCMIHALNAAALGVHLFHLSDVVRGCELLWNRARTERNYPNVVPKIVVTLKAVLETVERDKSDSRVPDMAPDVGGLGRSSEKPSSVPNTAQGKATDGSNLNVQGASIPPVPEADDLDFFVTESDPTPVHFADLAEEFLSKFVAESEEHLCKVEETLVALESGGATEEQLGDAFRAMHSFKGNCGICGFPDMERLTHRAETLMGYFRDKRRPAVERDISFLLELLDVLRATLATIPGGDGRVPNLHAILDGFDALERRNSEPASVLQAESPLAGMQERSDAAANKGPELTQNKSASSIRVDTSKLDDLMNLVGELIIAETTVTKNPDLEGYEFESFQKAALNLNRLTRSLQDIAMAVRMVPLAGTFRKMMRLVRDVAGKQKKRVELVCTGQDTEVDKTVIENIADPLVHLIRNSIDHGVETPAERAKLSKEPVGHVWLDAKHQGGEVWITIRDDGRGLNQEKILSKALERGIAEPGRRYTEREVYDFIFAAGFSTADKITDISGRGVGMDVVRRNIEAVNGRIDVASESGRGATFVLRIPLTLAIIEGMLVRIAGSYYTIPLLAIRESVRAQKGDITRLSDGEELLKLRRQHYPIVKLNEALGGSSPRTSATDGILVIVEAGDRLACIVVDEVVGQRQTVIKPLPEYLKRVRGLAGCSILHNGEISLILDVEGVVGSAENRAA